MNKAVAIIFIILLLVVAYAYFRTEMKFVGMTIAAPFNDCIGTCMDQIEDLCPFGQLMGIDRDLCREQFTESCWDKCVSE